MKNELLAKAMTEIDDALIAEADERAAGSKITRRSLMRNIYRFGSLAACALIMIGLIVAGNLSSQEVLLYGKSIAEEPGTVSEYMPRAVAHLIDEIDVEIPLELQFKKETALTLCEGSLTVLDNKGDTIYVGGEYTAKGSLSVILTIPAEATEVCIETDRSYNIVLTKDAQSGIWYVNIQK